MNELEKMQIDLEKMIDRASLPTVLEVVAQVCREKSHHIEDNWQDYALAKIWNDAGDTVEACATANLNLGQERHVI